MTNGGQINYSIGFNVNNTQLNQLKTSLQELQRLTVQDIGRINFNTKDAEGDLRKVKQSVSELQSALEKASNKDLGTVNISKFNQELKKLDLSRIYKDLTLAGTAGTSAFRNLSTQILQTNVQIKQSNKLLDDMVHTMKNTLKWGAASSIMNSFSNSVQQAYGYVKHLDSSLNDIRIVTGYSADEMDRFAEKANKAAKNLAASTTDYTEAALIYYQQGLSGDEVEKRAETTLKTANVTGQQAAEVSEQLTAVWNGYKVSAAETEMYVDKLAAVAASTASDLEELSTGMSKVASAAATSGVDIDQLSATLSTVISVTRQAPETVGTAFKTIYARLGDLAVDGVDEFGTSLGQISSKMKVMGIEILDETGNMREMGTVVEEVAAKWDTWSSAQKQAAAVAMAGKRQYNNLIALFENWDMYESSLQVSQNSLGTLSEQQEIYLDSAEAKIQQLKTSQEGLYDSLLDADTIKEVAGLLTGLVSGLEKIVDSIGGGSTVLIGLGAIFTKVFNKQLTSSLTTTALNFQKMEENAKKLQAAKEHVEGLKNTLAEAGDKADKATVNIVNAYSDMLKLSGTMNQEDIQHFEKIIQEYNDAATAADRYNLAKEKAGSIAHEVGKQEGIEDDAWLKMEKEAERLQNQGYVGKDLKEKNTLYKQYTNEIKEAKRELEKSTALFDEQKEKIKEAQAEIKQNGENLEENNSKIKEARAEWISQAETIASYPIFSGEDATEAKNALSQIAQELEKLEGKTNETSEKIEAQFREALEKLVVTAKGNFNEMEIALDQAATGMGQKIRQSMGAAAGALDEEVNKIDMTQKMQGVTNTLQNIEMLTFGLAAIKGAFQSLGDESLTTGEKIGQVFTGLLTASTMMLPAIIELRTSLLATLGTEKLLTIETLKETKARIASAGASITDAIAKRVLTHETYMAAKATNTLTLALLKNPYVIAAMAVAGLVAGLIILSNQSSEATKKLEEAKEATESARLAFEETQTAINDINTALGNWENAANGLRELEEGTAAWKQQLIEANNYILTLLDTYPQLSQFINSDDNGLLTISTEGLEYIQEENLKKLEVSQTKYALAQKNEAIAEKDVIVAQLAIDTKMGEGIADQIIEQGFKDGGAFLGATKEELTTDYNFSDSTADKIIKYSEEIRDALAQSAAHMTEAEIHTDTILNSALETMDGYAELSTEEQKIVKERLKNEGWNTKYESNYQTRQDDYDSGHKRRIKKDYQEFIGATDRRKGEAKGITEYYVDGVWTAVEDSLAIQQLAMEDTSEALGDLTTNLINSSESINNSVKKLNFSDENLEGIFTNFAEKGTANLSGLNTDQLIEISEAMSDMSEEAANNFAEQFGYIAEGAKSAGQVFQEKIDNSIEKEVNNRLNNIIQDLSNANTSINLHEQIESMSTGDFSDSQRESLNNIGGTAALLSTIDEKQISEMISKGINLNDVLAEIDWSELDSSKPKEWFKNAFETAIEEADYAQENEGDIEGKFSADAEEYGFEEEDYRDLTSYIQENAEASEDYADSLSHQEDAAQDVARAMLRYDKAMEAVNESGEDWLEMLEEQNDMEIATNIDSMADAYGNLLDMDPSSFSEKFLRSAENMKLMQAAAAGSEEAYNELMETAQNDIIGEVGLNKAGFEEDLNELATMSANMENQGLADLEAGATIDNSDYLAKLTEIINASDMTAQQASDLLATMGIDAEVVEDTTNSTENNEFGGAIPRITWKEVSADLPIVGEKTFRIPALDWDPNTEGIQSRKQFKAHSLKVKSARKSSGGGFKHKNTSHGGGTQGKKSSGGSGSGGSSTSKKTYQSSETKRDRYREVNNSLSKLSTELDRLAEKQEKLFGKDLLDNLNKQLDVLEQQKKVTEEKLAIAQKEAKEMRKSTTNERKGYYNDLKDFGITFDSEGNIENYQEKMKALEDEIARRNKYFNSKSAKWQSSEKGENYDEETARLEANRDTLEDLKEEYDTLLYDTIPGLVDEITQAAYDQIEIKLEAFQIEADLRLDITEARRNWAEFEAELAELQFPDDLSKQLQPTFDYIQEELGNVTETTLIDGTKTTMTKTADALYHEITTLTNDWQQWRELGPEGYTGQFSATGEDGEVVYDEATVRELIEENIEALQEEVLRVEEDFKAIHDGYLDSIDAVIEGLDEELEVLEYIGNQLEHNVRMTELLKGENAYADMAANYAAQRQNSADILLEYEQKMTYLQQEIANTTDEDAKKILEEEYRNTLENYEDALESAAELIQAEFENAVNLQLQKFDEALGTLNSNGDAIGTMGIKTQWEIDTNNADKYLDTVEKTFGIQDFANKVKTSIADTNSISAQKKLNNLLDDQLEKLREKDKLTQYDLDRANALYEIELKKIALEEAQNNKSQMRLRRDASGNYSYQFVADQDGVAQAQQELLEAQNNLYSLDKDTMRERQSELWDVYQEYQDLMIEYSQLSAAEREKYEDIYAAKFADIQSRMTDLGAECANIQINLAESAAATMAQAYEDMGKGIDYTLEEIVPKWATGMDEMIAKINAPDGSFIAAMDETFEEIKALGEQAATDMKAIGQKSAAAYTAASSAAKTWQESAEATTKELITQYDKLKAMNTEAEKLRDFWKEIETNIIAAAKATNDYNIAATGGEADEIQEGRTSDEGGTGGTPGDAGTGGTPGGTGTGSSKKELTTKRKKGIAEAIARLDNFGGWGKENTRKNRINNKFKKVNDKTAYSVVQDYVNKLLSGAVEYSFTEKQLKNNYKYSHFDTGGYTGDWSGDMGKMAVLHKKELILNAKDTVNILEAVKLLRTFADDYYKVQKEINSSSNNNSTTSTPIIENLAAMMTSAIALNMNKIISSFEPVSKNIKDLTTEEKSDIINIEINADFPNANSAAEIEQALLNLTNLATQRVHKNKRG